MGRGPEFVLGYGRVILEASLKYLEENRRLVEQEIRYSTTELGGLDFGNSEDFYYAREPWLSVFDGGTRPASKIRCNDAIPTQSLRVRGAFLVGSQTFGFELSASV